MPLPSTNEQWPPPHLLPLYAKMGEWAAWYSGEPSRIIAVYSAQAATKDGTVPWYRFWSRARAGRDGAQRALLHVPVASDLAATSGALLFGARPLVRVRAARIEDDPTNVAQDPTQDPSQDPTQPPKLNPFGAPVKPKPKIKLDSPEAKTEARLLEIMEGGDFYSRLVEAAESAAAIGGVYIYPVWDTDLRDYPLMAIAQSDQAVPEFRYGILFAVTFWRVISTNGTQIVRHLERHEVEGTGANRKAVVLNQLYSGTSSHLGQPIALGVGDTDTNGLEPRVELPFKELDVEYVPNIRPNRLFRASAIGVADIQGSESLLDALDETYASWMRDVRLAKARIIVPRDYLRPDSQGTPGFDIDQEIYVGMDMDPGLSQDARAMLAHQFQIRHLEHSKTAEDLVMRIVSNAGYAPQTLISNRADNTTGTGQRIAEHKTILTLRRKGGWWRQAIANTLYRMQLIDKEIFGSDIEPMRPVVTMADSIIDQPLEMAQTAMALKTAESASVETRVRLVHPDWSESEVDAEVARIQDETAAPTPIVSAGGKFGAPNTDPASGGNLPTTEQPSGPAPANAPPPQVKQP